MKNNFYEILLIPPEADAELLEHAYQQTLSALAKQLRKARERGQDIALLEEERIALEQAWRVLSDPVRRSRYDRFLELADSSPPHEADELWSLVSSSLLDPAAQATLDLVGLLTQMKLGAGGAARRRAVRAPSPRVAPAAPPARPRPAPAAAPTPKLAGKPSAPQVQAPGTGGISAQITLPGWQAPEVAPPPTVPPTTAPPAPAPQAPAQPPSAPAVREAPQPEHELGTDVPTLVFQYGYSGKLIRRLRQLRNLSLDQVVETTRIAPHYLEAIEADDFAHLPANTYVRGYLKELARLLELDHDALVKGYLTRMGR